MEDKARTTVAFTGTLQGSPYHGWTVTECVDGQQVPAVPSPLPVDVVLSLYQSTRTDPHHMSGATVSAHRDVETGELALATLRLDQQTFRP